MLFNYKSGLKENFNSSGAYMPGHITKTSPRFTSSKVAIDTNNTIEFGQAVKQCINLKDALYVSSILAEDEAVDFFGIVAKDSISEFTLSEDNVSNSRMIYKMPNGFNSSIVEFGEVTVPVQNGTPAIGGKVYMRIKANIANPNLPIGGIEATYVSGENVELTRCTFESGLMYPVKGTNSVPSSETPTSACAKIKVDFGASRLNSYFPITSKKGIAVEGLTDYNLNQSKVDSINTVFGENTIEVIVNAQLDAMEGYVSSDPTQAELGAKKWVGILFDTKETTIIGVKYNAYSFAEADQLEAQQFGGNGTSEFVLWIRAEDVLEEPKEFTLSKVGKLTTKVTVKVVDTSVAEQI